MSVSDHTAQSEASQNAGDILFNMPIGLTPKTTMGSR